MHVPSTVSRHAVGPFLRRWVSCTLWAPLARPWLLTYKFINVLHVYLICSYDAYTYFSVGYRLPCWCPGTAKRKKEVPHKFLYACVVLFDQSPERLGQNPVSAPTTTTQGHAFEPTPVDHGLDAEVLVTFGPHQGISHTLAPKSALEPLTDAAPHPLGHLGLAPAPNVGNGDCFWLPI